MTSSPLSFFLFCVSFLEGEYLEKEYNWFTIIEVLERSVEEEVAPPVEREFS